MERIIAYQTAFSTFFLEFPPFCAFFIDTMHFLHFLTGQSLFLTKIERDMGDIQIFI